MLKGLIKQLSSPLFWTSASIIVSLCSATDEIAPVIGIDLGTTFSCVSVFRNGKAEIISNETGAKTTPSWVAFTPNGRLVGSAAKNQVSSNPNNTVYDAKRLMGRAFNEKDVQEDMKHWPFKVVNEGNKPLIQVEVDGLPKKFKPEEISATLLQRLKQTAQSYLGSSGKEIKDAVITVPAYFNDAQRQATKDAGLIAGLNVLRIINEPTAAAMAYGIDKKRSEEQHIVVFDLGGGTFDVSVLSIYDGIFEVMAVNGNSHLGGQDFDNNIVRFLLEEIKKIHGKDLSKDDKALSKLRAAAEKSKIELSGVPISHIYIESILGGDKVFEYSLSRAKFEQLNLDMFKSTMKPVENALADSKLSKKQIDEVVLVGGSTRIPKIQELISKFFDGKTLNTSINPDEAVAIGAAIQGSILSGAEDTKDLLILDLNPLSLGIETAGGIFTKIIERNTTIPVKKSQIFSTASDNQTVVSIVVAEGERVMFKDNHLLGNFHLEGIPPAPRGVPQIEVTFELDANSILTVSAIEKATNQKNSINIKTDRVNSDAEIKRMVEDAEKFNAADLEIKAKIDARFELESYIYSIKSQINDDNGLGSKIDDSTRTTLTQAVAEKLKWIGENQESASKEDFEEQKAEMEKIFAPIISNVYQQGENNTGSPEHEDL